MLYSIPPQLVECDYLEHPEYGEVDHEGVYYGHKAIYSCHYGYKLIGKSTRKCLYDEHWSGEEPKCKKSKLRSRVLASNLSACYNLFLPTS